MKKILSFRFFEAVYLNNIKPFDKDNKHPKGLRFVNKEEALKSIRTLQGMIDEKEIELKDAIIAAYIISQRAELHHTQNTGIKEGGGAWKNYLEELKKKETV